MREGRVYSQSSTYFSPRWFVETARSIGGCSDTVQCLSIKQNRSNLTLATGRTTPSCFYYEFNCPSAWLVSICVISDSSNVCSETQSTNQRGISAFIPLLQHRKLTEKCCYRDLSLDHSCSSQPTQQESRYVNENNSESKIKPVKKKKEPLWKLSVLWKSCTFL